MHSENPESNEKDPAAHSVQLPLWVDDANRPGAQLVHEVDAAVENEPMLHCWQVDCLSLSLNVPAEHVPQPVEPSDSSE
jgi:hypothetical protein